MCFCQLHILWVVFLPSCLLKGIDNRVAEERVPQHTHQRQF